MIATRPKREREKTLEALRQTGYRLTPQRVMILSVIEEEGGHVSVERIHQRVKERYPYIDIATVYRTVNLLKKLHVVTEIAQGNVSQYELARPGRRHHHMVCEECGSAFDLPPHYLDSLKEQLVRDVGFEPHMEHFTISGLCARCTSAGQAHRATDHEPHGRRPAQGP